MTAGIESVNGLQQDIHLIRDIKQRLLGNLPAILLALLGLAAGLTAVGYKVGSFTSMGPGFFPLALGIILVLLGMAIVMREGPGQASPNTFAWRPFLAVSGGILAWVLLVESLGFFIASICQVVLCALALPNLHWRSILLLSVILTGAGYLLFVMQLGVPLSALG